MYFNLTYPCVTQKNIYPLLNKYTVPKIDFFYQFFLNNAVFEVKVSK